MARCELTGKGPVVKNLVSHSNIKTKSIAMPNVQKKRLFSDTLGQLVTLRLATSTIRSIQHVGGLDRYLLKLDDSRFSPRALTLKTEILKKMKKKNPATH